MSLPYIRNYYGVAAWRGGRIVWTSPDGKRHPGTITGAYRAYLRVWLDENAMILPKKNRRSILLHPTDNIRYLSAGAGEAEK